LGFHGRYVLLILEPPKIEFPLSMSRGILPTIQNAFNYYSDRLLGVFLKITFIAIESGLKTKTMLIKQLKELLF